MEALVFSDNLEAAKLLDPAAATKYKTAATTAAGSSEAVASSNNGNSLEPAMRNLSTSNGHSKVPSFKTCSTSTRIYILHITISTFFLQIKIFLSLFYLLAKICAY